ncbi:hypothetical protein B0H67DRAFT_587628 [Lasiosphaeris hirsuta]|uniref:Uncharacterized protein n=1 Tax=Lasiosphaeris hirsuta TaxID=260670 RepID=A0AA40A199_9PEZI|nr:hypothetical protein B0H67DRAFT_587628 [Lasiosphaeris hirsuta]
MAFLLDLPLLFCPVPSFSFYFAAAAAAFPFARLRGVRMRGCQQDQMPAGDVNAVDALGAAVTAWRGLFVDESTAVKRCVAVRLSGLAQCPVAIACMRRLDQSRDGLATVATFATVAIRQTVSQSEAADWTQAQQTSFPQGRGTPCETVCMAVSCSSSSRNGPDQV